eukprot:5667674-Pyramimonas_sp.AAC.1
MDFPTTLQGQLDLLNALATRLTPVDFSSRCATMLATLMNQMAGMPNVPPQQAARRVHLVAASQFDGPSGRALVDAIGNLGNPNAARAQRNSDILNIHHYLTTHIWLVIQDDSQQCAAKL